MKTKLLISGYYGALHKKLFDNFAKRYDLFLLDEAISGDKEKISGYILENQIDIILHFDYLTHDLKKTITDLQASLIFFKNIQHAALLNDVKKILLITDDRDLGEDFELFNADEVCFELTPPLSGYNLTKKLMTMLARSDKITTVLRFFELYGDRFLSHGTVMDIVRAAARGKTDMVLKSDRRISGMYIGDAVNIVQTFIENNFPLGEYNCVSPEIFTYGDVVKIVTLLMQSEGVTFKCEFANEGYSVERTVTPIKLMSVMLGYRFAPLSAGISKALAKEITVLREQDKILKEQNKLNKPSKKADSKGK